MPESVVIVHPDLPAKDGGNTATVPARSLHVWKAQGWKVAPKSEQPESPRANPPALLGHVQQYPSPRESPSGGSSASLGGPPQWPHTSMKA